MAKSLFDHINAICKDQNKKYWDTLDESDKKLGVITWFLDSYL